MKDAVGTEIEVDDRVLVLRPHQQTDAGIVERIDSETAVIKVDATISTSPFDGRMTVYRGLSEHVQPDLIMVVR